MTDVRGGVGEIGEFSVARERHRWPRRSAQALVSLVPVLWVLVVGWQHRWMTEDGFIYLRIVRHVREGNGPVFNRGERVEAYTGTLWVGILAVADLVTPFRLEWISIVLGLAGTAAGVGLTIVGARRLAARADRSALWVPLGTIVFVGAFPVWAYATSGLETGLVFGWLGACLWVLACWADEPGSVLSVPAAMLIGLGWLVRPEMALYSAAFVGVVALGQWSAGRRSVIRMVAAAVALPLGYQIFRMAFFGSLVPNTAIAKEGTSGQWDRGWRYFLDFAEPYWLWLAAIGLLLGGYLPLVTRLAGTSRRRLAVTVAFAGTSVVNAIYVIGVGGDYHHGRMFLPALFAVTAPVAAVPATRRHLAGLVIAGWAVFAGLVFRPEQHGENWLANGFLAPREFGKVTTDDFGWGEDGPSRAWFDQPGGSGVFHEAGIGSYPRLDLDARSEVPDPTVATWGVGVLGYSLGPDVHVIDLLGLADPLTAHLEGAPATPGAPERFPGHEKPLPPPWLAARLTPEGAFPPAETFPAFGSPLIPPTSGRAFDEQVAWARATLACDPVADLLRSSQGDLTPRRLVGNLVRSPAQTRLRIPADPEQAYRQLCGDDTPDEVRVARERPDG